MWDVEEAKKLIERARETDSVLAHTLADYLGYAMGTIEYYKSLFEKTENK
jgi:hypothetical protein